MHQVSDRPREDDERSRSGYGSENEDRRRGEHDEQTPRNDGNTMSMANGGKRPGSASLDGAVAYKLDIGNIIISLVFVFPGTRAAP